MISTGRLQSRPLGFGGFGEGNLPTKVDIGVAPVQTLPQYIIPGNLLAMVAGPFGIWKINFQVWTLGIAGSVGGEGGYWPGTADELSRVLSTGLLEVLSVNGVMTVRIMNKGPRSLDQIWNVNQWYDGENIFYDAYKQILTFQFNSTSASIKVNGLMMTGTLSKATYSGPTGDAVITSKKEPIELFVPLQTKAIAPSIATGLTVVENAQQILLEQGVTRQPVIATPLNPSQYVPYGSSMVIPINIPHGLWKISYTIGGVVNTGQLEIAEVGGILIGRMNVSGGMLYGSTGWEPISDIRFGGILTRTLSFVRDYTRQKWEGNISDIFISGAYGGGTSAGGGTFNGEKQPIEIFIPTDITKYQEQIVVTKEMPIATLIPIETVSGKATGKVVVEAGFAPSAEEAAPLVKDIQDLLPSIAPMGVSQQIEQAGNGGISPLILIAIGGAILLMMGRNKQGG